MSHVRLFLVGTLAVFCVFAGARCGSNSPIDGSDASSFGHDAGSTRIDAGSTRIDAGSTRIDAGSTGIDAGSTVADAGGGNEGDLVTITLTDVTCFTFATGAQEVSSTCSGDIYLEQGSNVDISSDDSSICPLQGTYTSLSQIPSSYDSCEDIWTYYVEAMGGIDNTGYIVKDATGDHHYKFLVVHDQTSTIDFRYSKID